MNHSKETKKPYEELLTTPSAIFSRLIADLQHARHSIDMEFYIFAPDRTGMLFAELLSRKARQGLSVRLLVDGFGSRALPRAMLRQMTDAGVDVCRYRAMGNCRNHRKMTIVDRRTAHVGGVNIADRYAVGNSLGRWHDVQLRFEGEGVATLCRLFDYDYALASGFATAPPAPERSEHLGIVWSEAGEGGAIARLLEEVVESAHHDITITTPYFLPPSHVIELLGKAVRRGVRVRVVLPERCDIWALDNIVGHYIRRAEAQGVELLMVRGAFLHAKLATVDGCRTLLGSANLDARSLTVNRELMLSTCSPKVYAAAEKFLLRVSQMATPPRSDEHLSAIPALVTRLFEAML